MLVDKIDLYGGFARLDWRPPIHTLSHVAYVPRYTGVESVGLYDHGQKLILSSAYTRGPNFAEAISPLTLGHSYSKIGTKVSGTFLYIGDIHPHYGHYILSTMSRYWPQHLISSDLPILYLDRSGGDANFEKPHIARTLAAVGIDRNRLVKFSNPCIIERVILPTPSFEEGGFAHKVFGTMCRDIGDKIEEKHARSFDSRPIYFSKLKLNFGVRNFVNELEICQAFESRGFEIVYPETLSLGQQIALWRSGRIIVSFVGSSLHSQVFSSNPKIVTINVGQYIPSSFLLCDWISNASSKYIGLDESLVDSQSGDYNETCETGFSTIMTLRRVRDVVDEATRACEQAEYKGTIVNLDS